MVPLRYIAQVCVRVGRIARVHRPNACRLDGAVELEGGDARASVGYDHMDVVLPVGSCHEVGADERDIGDVLLDRIQDDHVRVVRIGVGCTTSGGEVLRHRDGFIGGDGVGDVSGEFIVLVVHKRRCRYDGAVQEHFGRGRILDDAEIVVRAAEARCRQEVLSP